LASASGPPLPRTLNFLACSRLSKKLCSVHSIHTMKSASSMTVAFTILALTGNIFAPANASEFLRIAPHDFVERISEDDIRTSLLQEIESSLPDPMGTSSAFKRSSQIEAALRPIYTALPKNEHGNLEHNVARYALHRLFMLRHGWAVKGLGPTSGKYNASSPAGVLADQVPSFLADMFEQRLGVKGFKLHDLTVLAATIEHLIQEEAVHRLAAAFKIHDTSLTSILNDGMEQAKVHEMLDTYMVGYIVSENLTDMTQDRAQSLRAEIGEIFNFWRETQEFTYGVHKTVTDTIVRANPLASTRDFMALAKTAEAVGEQFGSFFHSTVCKSQKSKLMELEHLDTGRVKLSEFYKPALGGFWQFSESAGYLRELGALEETDPKEPSVLIANYLVAPANCIATSGFYSVCCKNECEGLLGHLEEKVAAPDAKPATIAAFIAGLSSSTVSAPRTLSATSLRRLDEIAANHGGSVPLHGRLFLQWMHHAYPRECPYPHMSGTTDAKLPDEWMEEAGLDITATEEEMRQYVQWSKNSAASDKDVSVEDLMMWSLEEELLVVQPIGGGSQLPQDATTKTGTFKKSMLLFAIVGLLANVLIVGLKETSFGSRKVSQKFVI